MNAYYGQINYGSSLSNPHKTRDSRFGDKLISFICNIIAIFTCSVAVKIEKALICTALFVSFFSVIGSVDSGSLSLLSGILLCGVISLFESLILKSICKRSQKP